MTLTILAAGMGSRYGGLKQLDPMTQNGEFIVDFSIFDALRAGIDRVVFIIKKENCSIRSLIFMFGTSIASKRISASHIKEM